MSSRHRKKLRAKPITRILFLLAILWTFFSFCESKVQLLPSSVLETSANAFAQEQMNEVIGKKFADLGSKHQLYFSEDGKASVLDTDAAAISALKADIARELNKRLSGGYTAYIPIGNLLNSTLMNGRGFKVPVRLYFNGSASVDLQSEIVSAGVNQSNFRLTAVVTAKLQSNSLTDGGCVSVAESYILCDTVLLGQTPMLTR